MFSTNFQGGFLATIISILPKDGDILPMISSTILIYLGIASVDVEALILTISNP